DTNHNNQKNITTSKDSETNVVGNSDDNKEKHKVKRKLQELGVHNPEQILSTYPLAVIQQQLKWLPYRNKGNVKNLAGLLIHAIKHNLSPPEIPWDESLAIQTQEKLEVQEGKHYD
ncbi:hypothetical protein IBX65_08910, partial [Candidatus Aerophobetes bacterium]|nr:hypothetical protein [Candidatus Aerophobetes bacterium]